MSLPRLLLPSRALCCAAALAACASAHAGRPLTVDDADVDPAGSAHVDSWFARQSGRQSTWNLAAAYVLVPTLEISGQAARNTTASLTSTALQMKWSMTPAQKDGCQLATTLGVGRTQHSPDESTVNTIMSCNDTNGAMHFNVGRIRPDGGPSATTWGVSIEIPDGRYTGYAEAFGQRGTSAQETTTYQLGLRAVLSPRWQVDGTWGRVRETRENLYSVGVAYRF